MKSLFQIQIHSINKSVLNVYAFFLLNIFKKLSIKHSISNLPTNKKRITVLKSPHVHKSSREQFEIKTYKLVISVFSKIQMSLLKFLIINKPKSLKLKIKKI
jgi:ribosomal protein S10